MAIGYFGYLLLTPFFLYLSNPFRMYFSKSKRNLRADRDFALLLDEKREIYLGLVCSYFSRDNRILRARRAYERRHGI